MKSLIGEFLNRSPVPLASSATRHLSAMSASSPITRSIDAIGEVGTLFSIVNRTSNATSQVDWKLYRTPRSGGGERTEVTRHAALDLWQVPNPTTPRQQFVEGVQQHIDLTGEGWLIIGRNPASPIPLELWYVRPDRMMVVVGNQGPSGYVYRAPGGEKVPLDIDQVISLIMPNPNDPWRGLGPVQSILVELDTFRFTSEWNRNFFRNSAEPGGMLETPVTMSDPEFRQFRTRWQEQHRGISNAHRVALLEGGVKWVGNQHTMSEMQFAELREVSRDTIREAFGFPKTMLGATDNVNRANAEAGKAIFAEWLLVPRLERWKSALNFQLLPLFGDDTLEFDYVNPVPASPDDERQQSNADSLAAQRYVNAGFHPDDVLDMLGLPPMRWVGLPKDRSAAGAGLDERE
jgi:HK97 family phage portal protein